MAGEQEVEQYFQTVETGSLTSFWKQEVNLLGRAEVEELTRKFAGHPVIDHLQGSVLDDPNTSDHHVLLRRAPLFGQILYLAHDDDSRIVFSSLAGFLVSAQTAVAEDKPLPEFHGGISPLAPDQSGLSALIRELVATDRIDAALPLIPSLDLSDSALLTDLVAHEDFFLGEAVANAIGARPSQQLSTLARQCAAHLHPQVARAGRMAVEACGE